MRQGPSNRRARGRGNNSGRRGNLPNRNQTFDSNGPDVRIRGTAFQVNEKYQALARDASASGDRIMAENYLQHAEHYYRIIAAINEAQSQSQQQGEGRDGNRQRDGNRDNSQRENGHRENGHRDGGHREAGNRDSGGREAGNRDSGNRDNGARENGHQPEVAVTLSDSAQPSVDAESEFGKDPRQDDPRDAADQSNGEAVIEVIAAKPEPEAADEAKANGADGEAEEAPAPKPRRRGPGRPRKAAAKKSAPASEAAPDGD